jgi:hypothetical protein
LRQETQDSYVPQSVAMSGPTEITDWQEGQPVPSGYHPVQRVRKGFIIAGAVTLGTMYLLTAFGAAIAHDANQNGSADALFIPVAGPFLQMSQTSYTTGQFLNIVDGLAQTGGLVMLVYGLSSPSTILIRNDVGVRTLLPVPYANSQGAGMGFVGTF